MAILAPATGILLEKTLDATYPHWNDGLTRAAYGRWFTAQLGTPWGRRHLTRWAFMDDDELLGTVKLYDLDAVLDNRPVRAAGIGAVFILPERRGRGIGRDLVERAVEQSARAGADVAVLFSEINPGYYARLGFVAIPVADLALRVVEDDRRGAPALMVRGGDDRDLPEIVAMDASRSAPFRFRLNRDRDLVYYALTKKRLLAGLAPWGSRELQFFVAEEGASAVAYVVISVKAGATGSVERVWTIESCGDRDPAGARLGAILQVLIARDPGAQRPTLRAWLPSTLRPPQMTVIESAPSTDVMMVRPLTEAGKSATSLAPNNVFYWRGDVV